MKLFRKSKYLLFEQEEDSDAWVLVVISDRPMEFGSDIFNYIAFDTEHLPHQIREVK